MLNSPPTPWGPRGPTAKERRAAPGTQRPASPMRRLKALLVRPLGLEWRGARLRLVLVDRRRAEPIETPLSPAQLRDELRARLLTHSMENTAQVMRHLALVHDELSRRGWAGVEGLPAQVLGQALLQARMLASDEATPALTTIVDRLQQLKVAAEVRKERQSRRSAPTAEAKVEVSEATQEEFNETERTWIATVPPTLNTPSRDR